MTFRLLGLVRSKLSNNISVLSQRSQERGELNLNVSYLEIWTHWSLVLCWVLIFKGILRGLNRAWSEKQSDVLSRLINRSKSCHKWFFQVERKRNLRLFHLKKKFQSCVMASNRAAFQIQNNTELMQKLGFESSIIINNCGIRKLQLSQEWSIAC